MKKTFGWNLLAMAAVAALAFSLGELNAAKEKEENVYELRVYTTHEGKLDDLHTRFRDHTNRLFVKHGMKLIGYWTPTDGEKAENTLIYVLSHKSKEAAKASFDAFRNDPEWKEAYRKSHENGPIVEKVESTFMAPTDYSPLK